MSIPQNRDFEENKMNINNPQDRNVSSITTTTTTSGINKPDEVVGTSSLSPDDQDYWYYCWRHSYFPVESDVQTESQRKWRYEKDKRHQRRMDALICNSYDMLKEYFDPSLYPNHKIPYDLFQACKGIVFLRIWKAGIFVGGLGGTGLVLAHRNGKWSNPCAVSIGGLQLGLHLGIERVDDILLLHDDSALNLLFEKGNFKLGADASIAIGPYGRDANMGVAMSGKDSKSIYSYSFAKGAFVGLSLDGGSITVNDSINEEFYGRKVSIKDVLYADIDFPQDDDFYKLKQLLNDYSLNQKINQPLTDTTSSFNPVANQ
jgi:lipid-binding SYLF domain-containing protein